MPTFRSEGLTLFYIDESSSAAESREPPALLIHGFASTHVVNWVNTLWVKVLTAAGRRVIAFDNRGHGWSDKPHDAESYHTSRMAADAIALLDHLGLEKAHIVGYSMGARIAAFVARAAPHRVQSVVLGGLGYHLVDRGGLPRTIAEAMLAPSTEDIVDPMGRLFRRFADTNGADREALAACITGSRQSLAPADLADLAAPVLVAVGDKDPIAGDPGRLAALLPRGEALEIPGRDHNLAVGDKVFKAAVLRFLQTNEQPAAF